MVDQGDYFGFGFLKLEKKPLGIECRYWKIFSGQAGEC